MLVIKIKIIIIIIIINIFVERQKVVNLFMAEMKC